MLVVKRAHEGTGVGLALDGEVIATVRWGRGHGAIRFIVEAPRDIRIFRVGDNGEPEKPFAPTERVYSESAAVMFVRDRALALPEGENYLEIPDAQSLVDELPVEVELGVRGVARLVGVTRGYRRSLSAGYDIIPCENGDD